MKKFICDRCGKECEPAWAGNYLNSDMGPEWTVTVTHNRTRPESVVRERKMDLCADCMDALDSVLDIMTSL